MLILINFELKLPDLAFGKYKYTHIMKIGKYTEYFKACLSFTSKTLCRKSSASIEPPLNNLQHLVKNSICISHHKNVQSWALFQIILLDLAFKLCRFACTSIPRRFGFIATRLIAGVVGVKSQVSPGRQASLWVGGARRERRNGQYLDTGRRPTPS